MVGCRRGKNQQKHFSVFVCSLLAPFQPTLNEEHSTYKWVDTSSVPDLGKLHPVVDILFREPHVKEVAAAVNADPEVIASGKKPKKLGAGLFFVYAFLASPFCRWEFTTSFRKL